MSSNNLLNKWGTNAGARETVKMNRRCDACENQHLRIYETPIGEVLVNSCDDPVGAWYLRIDEVHQCVKFKKRETR